jgi:chromosome segregation ATPase
MTGDSTFGGGAIGSGSQMGGGATTTQDGAHLKAWLQKSTEKNRAKEAKLRLEFETELEEVQQKHSQALHNVELRAQELKAQLEAKQKVWQADQSALAQRDETIRELKAVAEERKGELGRLNEELNDSKRKVRLINYFGQVFFFLQLFAALHNTLWHRVCDAARCSR